MYPSCDYTEKIKVNAENGFHLALLWFEFQIETSARNTAPAAAVCVILASRDEIQAGHFVCTVYTSGLPLFNTLTKQRASSVFAVPSRYPTDKNTHTTALLLRNYSSRISRKYFLHHLSQPIMPFSLCSLSAPPHCCPGNRTRFLLVPDSCISAGLRTFFNLKLSIDTLSKLNTS